MRFLERFMADVENIPMIDGVQDIDLMLWLIFIFVYLSVCVTFLILSIITLVATWRIFKKAGIPGWKSLIPIYNVYVMYKHFWNVRAFKRFIIWSFVSGVITSFMNYISITQIAYFVLYIALMLVTLFLLVNVFRLHYRLAKSFGRGFIFTLGLVFLSPFFYWILGLGDCEYVGDTYD